ncbi:MAG: histidine phosphatase family protein, partial [Chitinophagaceae bacterium]|nr:histidine phosphatase family protein [Rubrivivax sp.]
DTATLAFGRADSWSALGSPRAGSETTNAASLAALRRALVESGAQRGRFQVWVTHQFVLSDLVGRSAQSGEGLVLRPAPNGQVEVVAGLTVV